MLTRLGMEEGEAIESKMVSRRIEGAQKKVEERNFDARKNLLEYDEVMDEQRKRVYSFRQRLLDGMPAKDAILDMIDRQIKEATDRFLADDYGAASFAEWAGQRLGVEMAPKMFKGTPFEDAQDLARNEAEEQVTSMVREAVEENLPSDAEPSEWNWGALANWANTRYGLNLKDKDLRKFASYQRDELVFPREDLEEFLSEKATAAIREVDLSPAKEFLDADWGRRSLAGWVHHKFGLALEPAEWAGLAKAEVANRLREAARELYARKEAEFPIRVALNRFMAERLPGHQARYDREGLAAWLSERLDTPVDAEALRPMMRHEIEAHLIDLAHRIYGGTRLFEALEGKIEAAFGAEPQDGKPAGVPDAQALADLAAWAHQELGIETTPEELEHLGRYESRDKLINAIDARYRPEMRETEKVLVLDILDSSWMEHLRAMDHLRSSVGLRGYAQVDPKVEYKREGMKIFEEMWNGVSDKVTDLIFRVEQFNPDFLNALGSRWHLERAQTIHESAPPPEAAAVPAASGGIRAQQEAAIAASKGDRKAEPVRHTGRKVGRNDPCPCGSGKKFKACCMRRGGNGEVF
jgi:preprotein translocase subunit SecA